MAAPLVTLAGTTINAARISRGYPHIPFRSDSTRDYRDTPFFDLDIWHGVNALIGGLPGRCWVLGIPFLWLGSRRLRKPKKS